MKEHKLSKRAYLIVLFLCMAGMGILLVMIACNALIVKKVNLSDYTKTENVRFSLGEVNNSGSIVQIPDAWIFEPEHSVGTFDVHIALFCKNTGELYALPSQYMEREDVAEEWADTGYDYSRSGVYAVGILKLIGYRPDYEYHIYFLIDSDGEKKYVDTGVTLG